VAEDYSAYEDLGAQVIGLSVDSPYVNVKFAEACNAKFPIASDFNREATEAYDVVRADLGGLKRVSERAAFVIGRDGRIVYAWVGLDPDVFPPLDQIKDAVKRA
jgi:peroxiredoxin